MAEAVSGSGHLDEASHTTCFLTWIRNSVSSDEATLASEERARPDEVNSTFRPHSSLNPQDSVENYQPFTAHAAGCPETSNDGALSPVENVEHPPSAGTQWRPTYLRRRVLAAFSAVFLLMIAALESLSVISDRNDGIAKGANKDHYLWTYGPTAFLTLIAALYNRVEYQAKMMAPWERLSKQPAPAQKTLLLDYVSPLQPIAIYESLRNKDFAVAATAIVSVLIKLLIVLSSGLITLSRIGVHYAETPMEIQNAFVDDEEPLRAKTSLPYFVMQGLIEGSSFQGISQDFAVPSVQGTLPDSAQYQVIVDGLTTNLQCEIANIYADDAILDYKGTMSNVTIMSPGCNVAVTNLRVPLPPAQDSDEPHQMAFGSFGSVRCDGTTDEAGKRVLILFGLEEWFPDQTIGIDDASPLCHNPRFSCNFRGKLLKSAQLLCAPKLEIIKVKVVQNGNDVQSVMPAGELLNRTLDNVSPWAFMDTYFTAFQDPTLADDRGWRKSTIDPEHLILDDFMHSVVESEIPPDTNVSLLYDPNFVESIAMRYWRQVGAIIGRMLLMEPASINTTGSALVIEDRLVVRDWAVQWMAALISSCTVLSLFTVFIIPQQGKLRRSPGSLPGIAALVAKSPDLLERLQYSGDATSDTLYAQLDGSKFQSQVVKHLSSGTRKSQQYICIKDIVPATTNKRTWSSHQSQSTHSHPWVIHPASRLGLGAILVTLVVTIEVTLHQSLSHKGLGSVGDNIYIHYMWTSLPTLIFGGLAIMFSSMDFSIRSLAPYTSLSDVITSDTFRVLDLLDMSVPSAIIKEAKLHNIGALATTSTLLVASSFTIFSGSLFQGVYFASTDLALLRANSSFGSSNHGPGINTALIFLSNLSYPDFTYEDLAFPQFLPEMALTANNISNTSLLSIQTVVPALRSHLECRSYNASVIDVRIESRGSSHYENLYINIRDEGYFLNRNYTVLTINTPNTSYFGSRSKSGYSDWIFLWGKRDPSATFKVEHIAAMGCNQSIQVVDVETNFIGADLAIDMESPPRPVPNTERNSNASLDPFFRSYDLYDDIPSMPKGEGLGNDFALLTQSRWAIPLSMLGGGNDDIVAEAIKFQHGVIVAQALNNARVPAAESNATLTPGEALGGENDADRTIEATVVDNAGTQRVVQDVVSTRVLEALLLVTLVLLGVGWVWLPKTNVLPKRSPTTIANAVALLAGGNLEEWVHEMDSDAAGAKGGQASTTRFWMGWGNVPDEEGILMGNENENGVSRFGIFAVKDDHVDGK